MTRTARLIPILLILCAAVAGAVFLRDWLSFEALAQNRARLLAYRDGHFLLASLGFIAVYILIVGLSLPGATIATLTGGFLFGLFPGTLYSVFAAGTGAVGIFLAARAGFGATLAGRLQGGSGSRLQTALRENQWSALFIMRLVPALPFVLANLLPAMVGVRLLPFVVTTFLGIIPGTLVFTSVGAGLAKVFARGERPDLSVIFSAPVLLPLLSLAALAALPIILKKRKKDHCVQTEPSIKKGQ
ncbi:TVP38/TMEM64 family protein [Cypionkella aquatica]|uniref:TVP38/TMEM64 family membrane protein n=1 Tax=Cypionkella aquatica TaxID=1756042 RepID=A0AA37X3K8_9RHOB|nr:VTT domain-containing protein [Cypionkella aquatica]GLS88475.1 TVP38/TMEM64 family protein [Cypionkella aquatica]